jgi:hypothetical protein
MEKVDGSNMLTPRKFDHERPMKMDRNIKDGPTLR